MMDDDVASCSSWVSVQHATSDEQMESESLVKEFQDDVALPVSSH